MPIQHAAALAEVKLGTIITLLLNRILKKYAVEHHLSGLIEKTNHPDKQKIRIIIFFENRLHWPLEVRLLIFTACTLV
jgi:hypothetical protein